jgi:hypothetical protein
MDKITKNLGAEVSDVTDKGIVTIQITQFEKYDSDNDRMMKGALNKTWKEGKQVHLVDHRMGTQTFVGLPIKKYPDTGIIESKLNLNKQIGKDLLADYKFGMENGRSLQHSHGFIPVKGKYDENEKGGFDFKEINQMEYSTVIFGAVENTPIHSIKSKKDAVEIIGILETKLRTLNISDDYGKQIEKHINQLKSLLAFEPGQPTQQEAVLDTSEVENIFNNFKI